MSIQVIQPGLMTTIQDLGRFGSQKYGVVVSGSMDTYALRIANILVGNAENEGALEMTLLGATLQFTEDTLIALTGGDFQATIDGQIIPMWRPLLVPKGAILKCKSAIKGCRGYISFAGGLAIPTVMSSKSTYTRAHLGGFEGRALQKKDCLACHTMTVENKSILQLVTQKTKPVTWTANGHALVSSTQTPTIRILPGTEFDRFDQTSQQTFVNQPYTLTTAADRMGYRLEGTPLKLSEPFSLLSEGVTYGTIQVPPNGQPIILMADRQTTGGYPKIGQVISADLPKLAQLQANAKIRFIQVTMEEAERAFIEKEQIIQEIDQAIRLKLSN